MIKNMTTRLPRAGKIRLGSKKGANSPGRNLSYFRVESTYFDDATLKEKLGEQPTELRIKFPRIDKANNAKSLDYVFDASYKAYKQAQLFCKGDGESAMRAVAKGKLEQVTCTCDFLTGKQPICKQRGELKVVLSALPFMGYFEIGTTSWNSINSIQSVIDTYAQMLGDKFWVTEFVLFKEETFLSGHKQYIMRMKISPEYVNMLPTGSEINSVMMFEDEDGEEMPPAAAPAVSMDEQAVVEPVSDNHSISGASEPPGDELPPVVSPNTTEAGIESPAVNEQPYDSFVDRDIHKEETAHDESAHANIPDNSSNDANDNPGTDIHRDAADGDNRVDSAGGHQEQSQNQLPDDTDMAMPPAAHTGDDSRGNISAAAPGCNEPAEKPAARNITPRHRMKEQQLKNALGELKTLAFPTQEIDSICINLSSSGNKAVEQLTELEVQAVLNEVLAIIKQNKTTQDGIKKGKKFGDDEEVPF